MRIPFRYFAAHTAAFIVAGSFASSVFGQQPESTEPVEVLDTVTVTGVRPTEAGPQPGLLINRDQIPGNIQSVGKKEIKESHSMSLGDFMNSNMQSINVNDYSGNPFQADVNYRGFTASPQIGSPQGLSVFFDGIRVNEPFGDVVNWDMIPLNAIERFDLFPGSNPLFGLNTLGGALSLRTKSGFSSPGADVQVLGGSFGRKQVQVSGGANNGVIAGFGALHWFDEDGWRDDSPSNVKQFFGRADWRGKWGTVGLSTLLADNRLVGNGLIPKELYDKRAETVYTSPDETKNKLIQFAISGALDVTETFNITGQVYRRNSKRLSLNGDVYAGFDGMFASNNHTPNPGRTPRGFPICQFVDADNNGFPDRRILPDPAHPGQTIEGPATVLNGPNCDILRFGGQPRNGQYFSSVINPSTLGKGPGVVAGTPIGLLTSTSIDQITDGGALQFNWNLDKHQFMVGASVDRSQSDYSSRQRLGLIDADHRVYADASTIDPIYRAAQVDIPINEFEGSSRTRSLYFSETWSPRENVHVTLASRYNHTRVANQLKSRISGVDLHEIQNRVGAVILCPSNDISTCPTAPQALFINDLSRERSEPTRDEFIFKSLNPALGINWLPTPKINLFANASKGTRTPSVIELGCAFDGSLIDVSAGGVDTDGNPIPPNLQPRSFQGPTCTLPSTLSGDPFLPQIKATSFEIGARGKFSGNWNWNVSLYRTDLKDDIYFVGLSPERSYFDTVGKTRRQGLELGVGGRLGQSTVSVNYGFTDATFQSRFFVLSPHNSSADFDQNSRSGQGSPTANDNRGFGTFRTTRVDPGARMPGIPLHNLNASWKFNWNERFNVGISMNAHSKSFVRGNENNAHQPEGTDAELSSASGDVVREGRPFRTSGSVPGYAIFNLDMSYKFAKGFSISAQVNNLFDRKYFTAGRLGVSPFSPSVNGAIGPSGWNYNSSEWQNTTFVGPGASRGIWLALSYEFQPSK